MSQTPESTTPTAPAAGLLKASEAAATVDLSESDATVNNAAGLSREALELEVSQVLGTFNSWWGGVKKQSASAISTIQADLAKTVKQAQTDLEHLRTTQVEVVAKSPEQGESSNSFLDRLPVGQIQQTLQQAYTSANASNANQLRLHLAERLSAANLDISVKQAEKMAEDFLRKGEQWRKDAGEWVAGAVKVVPPEAQLEPTIGSRRAALIAKLQTDKDAFLSEPAGLAEWANSHKVEKQDEEAVGALRMSLVPEHLTDDQFWQRYMYQKHLINEEETRRQAIIQESQKQSQEEFNWDEPEGDQPTPTTTRHSEESYDVVSEQGQAGKKKVVEDEDSDWE